MFAPAKPFQPNLMFVGKTEHMKGAWFWEGSDLTCLKGFPSTSTLAYFKPAYITAVKKFYDIGSRQRPLFWWATKISASTTGLSSSSINGKKWFLRPVILVICERFIKELCTNEKSINFLVFLVICEFQCYKTIFRVTVQNAESIECSSTSKNTIKQAEYSNLVHYAECR